MGLFFIVRGAPLFLFIVYSSIVNE